jgi:nicotinamidase/pyrazinamidase
MQRVTTLLGAEDGEQRLRRQAPDTALLIIDVQQDFCPCPYPVGDLRNKGWGALAVGGGNDIVQLINNLRTQVEFGLVVLSQDFHSPDQASFASRYKPECGWKAFSEVEFLYRRIKRRNDPSTEIIETKKKQVLWPDHCINGTDGANFHPYLLTEGGDVVVRKGMNPNVDSYSAFFDNLQSQQTPLDAILKERKIKKIVVVGLAFDYCVGSTAIDGSGKSYEAVVCVDACRAVDPTAGIPSMLERLRVSNVGAMNCSEYIQSVPSVFAYSLPTQPKPAPVLVPMPNEVLVSINGTPIRECTRAFTREELDRCGRLPAS